MKNTFLSNEVKISDDILIQEIEGESVLLNLATEQYYGLDEVGTRFWHLLAEDGKIERALEIMNAEYDVDEGVLRNDLANLVEELNSQGLIAFEK